MAGPLEVWLELPQCDVIDGDTFLCKEVQGLVDVLFPIAVLLRLLEPVLIAPHTLSAFMLDHSARAREATRKDAVDIAASMGEGSDLEVRAKLCDCSLIDLSVLREGPQGLVDAALSIVRRLRGLQPSGITKHAVARITLSSISRIARPLPAEHALRALA